MIIFQINAIDYKTFYLYRIILLMMGKCEFHYKKNRENFGGNVMHVHPKLMK